MLEDPSPTVSVSTGEMPTWLIVVEAVAAIVIGFFFFFQPTQSVMMAAVLLSVYWLVRIGLSFLGMLWDRNMWGWKLFLGVLGVVAAIMVMQGPVTGATEVAYTFVLLIGIYGVMVGTLEVYMGLENRQAGETSIGAVSFLLGFFLLLHPVLTVSALLWICGGCAIIGGAVTLWAAFSRGQETEHPEAMHPA